tara:strand:- start:857 stop:1231 length:375 start_codon:yes stop_codon:yes gene_type:complete
MSKIFIGIILALLLAFGGYYWISEKRIATLTENNAKLTIAAQTNQETIDKLEEDNKAFEVANKELQIKYKEAEAYGDELSRKLREHDLTRLTLRKPGLIEKRVNDATAKVFEDLESSTAIDPND